MFKKFTADQSKSEKLEKKQMQEKVAPIGPFSKGSIHTVRRRVKPKFPATGLGTTPLHPSLSGGASVHRVETFSPKGEGKKLVVGKAIKLTGDIDVCESLVVEGQLEANLSEAHVFEIVPGGSFKGNAEVDEVHISGLFDGTLTVHQTAVIYSGAEVKGKLRYADLVVESGAIIKADLRYIGEKPKK